jgi:Fe-S cluster biogenesis protein NfuA
MGAPQNLRAVGDQIEQLLDELQATADPRSYERAAELLRLVSELYGAGLARVVELAQERGGELVEAFVGDDLVASLLLVHGLHPETLERRLDKALAGVRPFLASHGGDVELLDIDAAAGAVRLRLLGSCDGCPSSAVTLQLAVERAITEAAPEIVRLEVDEPSKAADRGAPVALGTKPVAAESRYSETTPTKPVYTECPAEMAAT